MEIEKKTWPDSFEKILLGEKGFDIRLADFDCKPGDTLIFREWNPDLKTYTGRSTRRTVKYVGKTKDMKYWPKWAVSRYGFQVIGFKE